MGEIDGELLKALRLQPHQREEEAAPQRRGLWVGLGAVVLLAALAAGAWMLWPAAPVPVALATATAAGAAAGGGPVLQATGYVTARRRATVSTQITGTLTEVLIEEGDAVRKGQVLARLEDDALRAALDAAEASVRVGQAQVALAQAQLRQAEADAERNEALAARGMVARQSAEQSRTAVATFAAQFEARRREAEAARAQAAQARVNFDYTVVRAPFAGVVTEKAAQVGEIVSPFSAGGGFTRTGVGTIVDMDSLEVEVDVNEAYIGQVRADMAAEAVLDAYPDWRVPARVIAIVPSADRGKATVKVRVALEQKDARIVPDMGVRVAFLAGKPAAAAQVPTGTLVPAAALVQRADRTVLFVVKDGRATLRPVTAGEPVGAMRRVSEGLAPGEQVVVSPPADLRDGAAVQGKDEAR